MKTQEAAQWLLRLQGDNVPQSEIAAWLDWCNADPANLEAFDRAQGLYDGLRGLDEAVRADFLSLAEEDPMSAGAASHRLTANGGDSVSFGESANAATVAGIHPLSRLKRVRWISAIAASLVVICVGALVWYSHSSSPALESARYKAEHGVNRDLMLADQSQVVLGAATELSSRYTAEQRTLTLGVGEAFFKVQHDRSRPFVVQVGAVTVTAVGTAFNVRRAAHRTVISVTEGAVNVATSEAQQTSPVRVSAGQQAVYAPEVHGLNVSSVDPAAVTARQSGRFEYLAEPLGSVLADVNRYSAHPIVAADDQVRDLVFTGTVFRQRAEEWALALHTVFPVDVSQREDGSVVLSARR